MKKGWKLKPLAKVCQIRPPKKEARELLTGEDLVSFVPMDSLGIDEKYFKAEKTKALSKVSSSYTYFKEGDVLLAKITPCFENGKLGIAKDLINQIGFGSSEYIVYRAFKELNNEYLYYFLNQESFRIEGASQMTGAVGHKRIPKDFYENYKIPIPPLPEQKQIVSILDRAFAAIDQAKANIEKNIQNAEELFQSKLNQIFSQKGKGWEEKKLGDVCENLDRQRKPITKSKRKPGNFPYYGASGIVDYVEGYLFEEELLLVSEDGANLLARTYPIAFSVSGKIWVNNHAHVLKFKNRNSQLFIEFYLNSISLAPWVSGMAQPKLNQRMLNSIPVPFPSLQEQERIIQNLDKLKVAKENVLYSNRKKLAVLEELKKSLLQKAFTGELTKDYTANIVTMAMAAEPKASYGKE